VIRADVVMASSFGDNTFIEKQKLAVGSREKSRVEQTARKKGDHVRGTN
jgi:hypothetical protein